MLEIISILAGGAGGGIFGVLAGIFKNRSDNKHREEMARIANERDEMEYTRQRESEENRIELAQITGQLEADKIELEGDIAADLEEAKALGKAQEAEFGNLNTSTWMDNFRASVRPVLSYLYTSAFFTFFYWAFNKYSDMITDEMGGQILLGMFATMEFATTSILGFYFVSRRNARPHL